MAGLRRVDSREAAARLREMGQERERAWHLGTLPSGAPSGADVDDGAELSSKDQQVLDKDARLGSSDFDPTSILPVHVRELADGSLGAMAGEQSPTQPAPEVPVGQDAGSEDAGNRDAGNVFDGARESESSSRSSSHHEKIEQGIWIDDHSDELLQIQRRASSGISMVSVTKSDGSGLTRQREQGAGDDRQKEDHFAQEHHRLSYCERGDGAAVGFGHASCSHASKEAPSMSVRHARVRHCLRASDIVATMSEALSEARPPSMSAAVSGTSEKPRTGRGGAASDVNASDSSEDPTHAERGPGGDHTHDGNDAGKLAKPNNL